MACSSCGKTKSQPKTRQSYSARPASPSPAMNTRQAYGSPKVKMSFSRRGS